MRCGRVVEGAKLSSLYLARNYLPCKEQISDFIFLRFPSKISNQEEQIFFISHFVRCKIFFLLETGFQIFFFKHFLRKFFPKISNGADFSVCFVWCKIFLLFKVAISP